MRRSPSPTATVAVCSQINTDKYRIAALNAAAASGSGTALEGVIVAAPIMGDTGSGTVMAMNAANVYGNVNDDNAIQFIGMSTSGGFAGTGPNAGSGGTVVRLIAGKANDSLHHYIRMVTDTDLNDIAAGLKSGDYVLEVFLATDGAGKSITTAKDLAAYFDREDVKAQGTNGISAEVYYPDGVDPNWLSATTGATSRRKSSAEPPTATGSSSRRSERKTSANWSKPTSSCSRPMNP